MTSYDFIQEALLLRRPCTHLGSEGEFFAGHLGEFNPQSQGQLLFSVDELLIGGHDPEFEVQFFTEQGNVLKKRAHKTESCNLPNPIFATKATSYPPIEAVFLNGSAKIHSWLENIGWGVCAEFNDNFPCPEVTNEYENLFHKEYPLYRPEIAVCLGGWHFPWPSNDWEQRTNSKMLAFINYGHEPWLEIWQRENELELIERYT